MSWDGTSHPLELIADWVAPLVLAAAAGWSASLAGLTLAGQAAAIGLSLAFGVAAMRRAGAKSADAVAAFEPVEFASVDHDDPDVLLLDDPLIELPDDSDVLLLDDPLIAPPEDSRVVRLFDRQDFTPGELVLRISDYLNEQGREPQQPAAAPADLHQPDATEALHAALANIRASLR